MPCLWWGSSLFAVGGLQFAKVPRFKQFAVGGLQFAEVPRFKKKSDGVTPSLFFCALTARYKLQT
nr:hypothetical protein [Mucilaginibacter sp. L294]